MKLIQIYGEDSEPLMLLNVVRDTLSDAQIEEIVRKAGEFPEEEDGEAYLEENGIERVFVDEIYL